MHVCEQIGAPGASVCLGALDEASSHRSGCWWKQGRYNQRSCRSFCVNQCLGLAVLTSEARVELCSLGLSWEILRGGGDAGREEEWVFEELEEGGRGQGRSSQAG